MEGELVVGSNVAAPNCVAKILLQKGPGADMCIHFWIKKAAIDLATSRPRKRDVGASEELIDGRVATAYLHDANAGADAVMFYSDLDRLFYDLEQPAGNHQSVFRVHACHTHPELI